MRLRNKRKIIANVLSRPKAVCRMSGMYTNISSVASVLPTTNGQLSALVNKRLINVKPVRSWSDGIWFGGTISEGRPDGKAAVVRGAEADAVETGTVVVASSGLVRVCDNEDDGTEAKAREVAVVINDKADGTEIVVTTAVVTLVLSTVVVPLEEGNVMLNTLAEDEPVTD